MRRDDTLFLEMLLAARDVRQLSEGVTVERFQESLRDRYAISKALEMIGESAAKISDVGRAAQPEIPWRLIVGLRHRLVHDYRTLDLVRLWRIVEEDVPPLIEALERIVPPEPS